MNTDPITVVQLCNRILLYMRNLLFYYDVLDFKFSSATISCIIRVCDVLGPGL